MTTPAERTRALRLTSEFLQEIRRSADGDPEWRRQADVILRHYPSPDDLAHWARIGSLKVPTWTWLAPEQAPPTEASAS